MLSLQVDLPKSDTSFACFPKDIFIYGFLRDACRAVVWDSGYDEGSDEL
jgi:hypothetical protein